MTAKRVLNLVLDDVVAEDFDTKTPHSTDVSVQYTLKVKLSDGTYIDADPDIPMFWSALLDAVMATVVSDQCTLSADEARRILGAAFVEVIRILDLRAAQEEMVVKPAEMPLHVH